MDKSKLSMPLEFKGENFENDLKYIYNEFFKENFINKENRPRYRGKFIFFPMDNKVTVKKSGKFIKETLEMPERFYHICSLEGKEKYTMYPCANDKAVECCQSECVKSHIKEFKNINRTECYYRMSRINHIAEVIKLANDNDPDIQEWAEEEKDKNKNKVIKRFIRYKNKKDDYLVILKEEKKENKIIYRFITAFPVFYKSNKTEYDKKYKKYKEKYSNKEDITT